MTVLEEKMYEILERLSLSKAPLVFKGGLITNLILDENDYNVVRRSTIDIDANWIDTPPTMEYLVSVVRESLGDLNNEYIIESFRDYGENKSAGLAFFSKSDIDQSRKDKLFTIDIEIKPVFSHKVYYFGEIGFRGVLPVEIIADKICSSSSDSVYKHRAKDIVDIYTLTHCIKVNTKEIFDVCEIRNKSIHDFNGLLNNKSLVEHAYSKLRRIDNKPDFNDVYDYLVKFLKPFITKDKTNKTWNHKSLSWEDKADTSSSYAPTNLFK